MTDTRQFPTLDVFTVVTGTLVSDRGIASVYEVCNWMLDDELMTHQLPNASRVLSPHILQQHPWMLTVDVPTGDIPALKAMCARISEEHGDTITLTRPDEVDWVRGNGLADLLQLAAGRPVLEVRVDGDDVEVRTHGTTALTIPKVEIQVDATQAAEAIGQMKRAFEDAGDAAARGAATFGKAAERLRHEGTE